jgi:hypothetical protein
MLMMIIILEMNPTKSLYFDYFCVCSLFIAIVLITGCTGIIPVLPASTENKCSIPILEFNNSQEITKLDNSGLGFTIRNTSPRSEPGTVPFGGVVYQDTGFTRIFDSEGKQILFVNDTESLAFTPAGIMPSTRVYYISDFELSDPNDNIMYLYEKECIATIIKAPSSKVSVIYR